MSNNFFQKIVYSIGKEKILTIINSPIYIKGKTVEESDDILNSKEKKEIIMLFD